MVKREVPLYTWSRYKVLKAIKKNEPISIEELTTVTKPPMSRATIYLHLKVLEDKKLITIEEPKKNKKGKYALGQPRFVSTTKSHDLFEKTLDVFRRVHPKEPEIVDLRKSNKPISLKNSLALD